MAASLRVARDIVRIARQGLRAPITSPSNDFAELAVEPGAESTNFAVGGLFKLLVARFAKDGPEAPDVAAFFPCLGVCPSVGGTLRIAVKVPGERNSRLCKVLELPFGAVVNVAASLRIARGVVHIARRGLGVPITSFSDNFAALAVKLGAGSTNIAVGGLFKLLDVQDAKTDLNLRISLMPFHVLEW